MYHGGHRICHQQGVTGLNIPTLILSCFTSNSIGTFGMTEYVEYVDIDALSNNVILTTYSAGCY